MKAEAEPISAISMARPRRAWQMPTVLAVLAAFCPGAQGIAHSEVDFMDRYNVVWDTPSADSSGSMPLGNGDIGLNVWVEGGGDLLCYLSKTDAWSENVRPLKLGRVRIRLSPNPFLAGAPFAQTLRLRQGEIEIRAGAAPAEVVARIWVDANQPLVRVEVEGNGPVGLTVTLESWRTEPRTLSGRELHSAYGAEDGPKPVVVMPDTILPASDNRIVWFHRNAESIWPDTMTLQGMPSWAQCASDPLLNRTFGGVIKGEGLVSDGPSALRSSESRSHHLVSIYVLTAQTPTPEEWLRAMDSLMARVENTDIQQARTLHHKWWNDFWNRSWIRVTGAEDAEVVTRGYILQRFITACAGRGAYPVKFNGSIFTVDAREPEENYDADYRRWGGPYWFQNTRLIYWPLLASGDFDMMQPLFRMFVEAMPLARERTRIYFGHEGVFFPETMYFWGAYANTNYGWNRQGKQVSQVDNTFIRCYWSGALELLALALDYYAYTSEEHFARDTLLPLADGIIRFYDQHYPRDDEGKILFQPAQALESWHEAVNPLPEIAGLTLVLQGLLSLPHALTTSEERALWQRLLTELPPTPTTTLDSQPILAAAQQLIGPIRNSENPELYAVFPYRLYGVLRPDLEMARRTFAARRVKGHAGWQQDDTQAALLGLAQEARAGIVQRFSAKHPGSRFPAFWGPNFDWIPDQDHGCNGVMALQTMLLQSVGSKIALFPAWPKDWDVEFKLHAPANTAVQGVYRAGKLESLEVTPEHRARDLVVLEPQ